MTDTTNHEEEIHVLDFAPPVAGLDGLFNTIRLGPRMSRVLVPSTKIVLVHRPKNVVLGFATVIETECATLREIAHKHAHLNHNQKGLEPEGAAQRLIAAMVKRYGPQKVNEDSKVSMILLQRKYCTWE